MVSLVLLTVSATPAMAQIMSAPDLANASLEDLMKVTITSASRREQSAFDVAGAVYVITQDDIRRSGLTSVPELLRLAPGVQVARIDTNKWAIAIRGFNFRWSNKLLVLMDGRPIYNRVQSGVFWEMVDLPVELIDRIEIIRGPGGSLWGANAVDGVVNILTRTASSTRGGLVRAGGGALGQANVFSQFSGSTGRTAYRVYGQGYDRGHSTLPISHLAAGDDSHSGTGGFRLDVTGVRDTLTFQGDGSKGRGRTLGLAIGGPIPPAGGWLVGSRAADWTSANVLGQWTHPIGEKSSVQLQGFVDRLLRHEPDGIHDHETSVDVGLMYRTQSLRHNLVSGVEFHRTDDTVEATYGFSVTPAHLNLVTVNLFAQDEVALAGDRVRLTFGSKLEHDTLGGWSVQPTARALWKVDQRQRLWAAVSHAVRTPARVDRGMLVHATSFIGAQGLPIVIGLAGSPAYRSEDLKGLEAGYRIDLGPALSLDIAGFSNHYAGLQSLEPQAPVLLFAGGQPYLQILQVFGNNQRADTRGVELTTYVHPRPWWQIQGSVSTFHMTPHPLSITGDPLLSHADGNVPGYGWQIRNSLMLGSRLTLDASVFAAGAIRTRDVPSYSRADVRASWNLTPRLSASVAGQNLFGRGHVEFGGNDNSTAPNLNARTSSAQLAWRF